jgi:hypothetical protein
VGSVQSVAGGAEGIQTDGHRGLIEDVAGAGFTRISAAVVLPFGHDKWLKSKNPAFSH